MEVMNYRPFLLPGLVLGLGIVAVLTFALFQRREDYLHA
jgi:ABC-type Fe3+ transport system permease subunit